MKAKKKRLGRGVKKLTGTAVDAESVRTMIQSASALLRAGPDAVLGSVRGFAQDVASGEGVKHDAGKPRLSLFPREAIEEIGKVLTFGAKKYADHNWRRGMAWSRLADAALRHLFAWIDGEGNDPEWGLSHLAHAGCCIAFLIAFERSAQGTDDRYKRPTLPELMASVSHDAVYQRPGLNLNCRCAVEPLPKPKRKRRKKR